MLLEINCPKCNEPDTVSDDAIEKRAKCNACNHVFSIRDAVRHDAYTPAIKTSGVDKTPDADISNNITNNHPWTPRWRYAAISCGILFFITIIWFIFYSADAFYGPWRLRPYMTDPTGPTYETRKEAIDAFALMFEENSDWIEANMGSSNHVSDIFNSLHQAKMAKIQGLGAAGRQPTQSFIDKIIMVGSSHGVMLSHNEAYEVEQHASSASVIYGISKDDFVASYLTLRSNPQDPHSHTDAILNTEAVLRTLTGK